MILALSTNNKHKAKEIEQIFLANHLDNWHLILPRDVLDTPFDVEENGSTLEENASIKANALFYEINRDTNRNRVMFGQEILPVIADDTGLEVFALNCAPGVYSARYSGLPANDARNRQKLLADLDAFSGPQRRAQFRTALCLKTKNFEKFFIGICKGEIIDHETGENGFGYDSLFMPEGYDKTFAEMVDEDKNAISHRGRAIMNLIYFLREESGQI
jgi:XTP/dITP diphosphohydrolase